MAGECHERNRRARLLLCVFERFCPHPFWRQPAPQCTCCAASPRPFHHCSIALRTLTPSILTADERSGHGMTENTKKTTNESETKWEGSIFTRVCSEHESSTPVLVGNCNEHLHLPRLTPSACYVLQARDSGRSKSTRWRHAPESSLDITDIPGRFPTGWTIVRRSTPGRRETRYRSRYRRYHPKSPCTSGSSPRPPPRRGRSSWRLR